MDKAIRTPIREQMTESGRAKFYQLIQTGEQKFFKANGPAWLTILSSLPAFVKYAFEMFKELRRRNVQIYIEAPNLQTGKSRVHIVGLRDSDGLEATQDIKGVLTPIETIRHDI